MNALGACGQRLKPTLLDTGALARCPKPLACPKRPSDEAGMRSRHARGLLPQPPTGAPGIQAANAPASPLQRGRLSGRSGTWANLPCLRIETSVYAASLDVCASSD